MQSCGELLQRDSAQIRQETRVIGLLVAATPAVVMGRLHYRKLEPAKVDVLLKYEQGDFDGWTSITMDMKTRS